MDGIHFVKNRKYVLLDIPTLRAETCHMSTREFGEAMLSFMIAWKAEKDKQVAPGKRPSPEIWAKLRLTVFRRDGFACVYCGVKSGTLECDHVIPVSKGGTNDIDNLVASCRRCNRSKSAKSLEEWKGRNHA